MALQDLPPGGAPSHTSGTPSQCVAPPAQLPCPSPRCLPTEPVSTRHSTPAVCWGVGPQDGTGLLCQTSRLFPLLLSPPLLLPAIPPTAVLGLLGPASGPRSQVEMEPLRQLSELQTEWGPDGTKLDSEVTSPLGAIVSPSVKWGCSSAAPLRTAADELAGCGRARWFRSPQLSGWCPRPHPRGAGGWWPWRGAGCGQWCLPPSASLTQPRRPACAASAPSLISLFSICIDERVPWALSGPGRR